MTATKILVCGQAWSPMLRFIDVNSSKVRAVHIKNGTDDTQIMTFINNSIVAIDYAGNTGIFDIEGAPIWEGNVTEEYIRQFGSTFTTFDTRFGFWWNINSDFGNSISNGNNVWVSTHMIKNSIVTTKIDITIPGSPVFTFFSLPVINDAGDFTDSYISNATGNGIDHFIFGIANANNEHITFKFDILTGLYTTLPSSIQNSNGGLTVNNTNTGLNSYTSDSRYIMFSGYAPYLVDATGSYVQDNYNTFIDVTNNISYSTSDAAYWTVPPGANVGDPSWLASVNLVPYTNYTITATILGNSYTVSSGTPWANFGDLLYNCAQALQSALTAANVPNVYVQANPYDNVGPKVYYYGYTPEYIAGDVAFLVGGVAPLMSTYTAPLVYNFVPALSTAYLLPTPVLVAGESFNNQYPYRTAINLEGTRYYSIWRLYTETWSGFSENGENTELWLIEERNISDNALISTQRYTPMELYYQEMGTSTVYDSIRAIPSATFCDETYLYIISYSFIVRMDLATKVITRIFTLGSSEEDIVDRAAYTLVTVDKKTISGKVKQDGVNSPNRKINLMRGGVIVDSVVTDANGDYSITYLGSDPATLVCEGLTPEDGSIIKSNLTGT